MAILISGRLGSGKTAVATEIGACLDERGVANAVIDLDWLCWAGPAIGGDRLLAILGDNLRMVARRYREEGIHNLVLARALTRRADLEAIRAALNAVALTVVTLRVPESIATARLSARDQGAALAANLAEQREFDVLDLGADGLEVDNAGRGIRDTADEVLRRAGWIGQRTAD
jgi:adenylylsulfate kinase